MIHPGGPFLGCLSIVSSWCPDGKSVHPGAQVVGFAHSFSCGPEPSFSRLVGSLSERQVKSLSLDRVTASVHTHTSQGSHILVVALCFVIFVCLGATPRGAQGSLLTLCSGINPGGATEIIHSTRDETQLSRKQGKLPTHCATSQAPTMKFSVVLTRGWAPFCGAHTHLVVPWPEIVHLPGRAAGSSSRAPGVTPGVYGTAGSRLLPVSPQGRTLGHSEALGLCILVISLQT